MKKFLTFILAIVMLISCVACNNTKSAEETQPTVNDTNSTENANNNSNVGGNSSGYKAQLPADLPLELRAPTEDASYKYLTQKPFEENSPIKAYLENKYGVTAYMLENPNYPDFNKNFVHFTLEGFEASFTIYSKEYVVSTGVSADSITTDYVDTAWFTVMYPDIQAYFAKIIQDAGVSVERVVVEQKCAWWFSYDTAQPFGDALKAAPVGGTKFNLSIYGSVENEVGSYAVNNMIAALEELNLKCNVKYYVVLQDITDVSNKDLLSDYANAYSVNYWSCTLNND